MYWNAYYALFLVCLFLFIYILVPITVEMINTSSLAFSKLQCLDEILDADCNKTSNFILIPFRNDYVTHYFLKDKHTQK